MKNTIKKLGFTAAALGLFATSAFTQSTHAAQSDSQVIPATLTVTASSTADLKEAAELSITTSDDRDDQVIQIRYDEASGKWMISKDQGKTWEVSDSIVTMTKIIDASEANEITDASVLTDSQIKAETISASVITTPKK